MTHITKQVIEELSALEEKYWNGEWNAQYSFVDWLAQQYQLDRASGATDQTKGIETNLQPEHHETAEPENKRYLGMIGKFPVYTDSTVPATEPECKHSFRKDNVLCGLCVKENNGSLGMSGQPPTREPIEKLEVPEGLIKILGWEKGHKLLADRLDQVIERVNQLTGNTR